MNKAKIAKKLLRDMDKKWSIAIHNKFNNRCAFCGSTRFCQAHHIISRSFRPARHDILNGVLLCSKHHLFDRLLSAHKGSFMFMLWFIDKYKEVVSYLKEKYESEIVKR